MTTREPAMPMDELRRRYASLGMIEEMMGERSYLGRCSTFEWFLVYGPLLADDLRAGYDLPAVRDHLPGLGRVHPDYVIELLERHHQDLLVQEEQGA